MPPPRILHLHSTFNLGGKEARDVALINHWGDAARHVIVSAEPSALGARELIAPGIDYAIAHDAPALAGPPSPRRTRTIGRWIAGGGFDLVLSFNWGAIDGVLANRFGPRLPLVHHEDGFNEDELHRQKPARRLLRRALLPGVSAVVVPSRTLEAIARATWGVRPVRIPNGVASAAFAVPPAPGAIPGLARRPGEVVVGTLAGLRPVKNLPRLVRTFARAVELAGGVPARLVIVGRGPEEARIRAEAARLGIADRLVMPGFLANPARYVGLFDIFALSSDSEQFPISLVEAMAAGLPAAATRVGDVAEIAGETGAPFLAAPADEPALAAALARLIADADLRQRTGAANRARVIAHYTVDAMRAAYARVYGGAMGRRLP